MGEEKAHSLLGTALLILRPLCVNMYRTVKCLEVGTSGSDSQLYLLGPGNAWRQELLVVVLRVAVAAAAIGYIQTMMLFGLERYTV